MLSQNSRAKTSLLAPSSFGELIPRRAGTDGGQKGLCERVGVALAGVDQRTASQADILVSRWTDLRNYCRYERRPSSGGRHVIGVSLEEDFDFGSRESNISYSTELCLWEQCMSLVRPSR